LALQWFEGNYVLLQADAGSYHLRVSISSIAKKLRPYGFLRIHRSVLVNASFVEELQPLPTGEYTLRIKGGKEYAVVQTTPQAEAVQPATFILLSRTKYSQATKWTLCT
jgi:DNA-binding LytR/AlgR family response regulator